MPQPNATDQTLYYRVVDGDGADAVAATLNAAIGSISLNYKTSPTTATVTTALTALAAETTAHTDNYAFAVGVGFLRVDWPDAPWATGSAQFPTWLTFSGGLAGYTAWEMPGILLRYALQNPDSGSTKLALDVKSDAIIAAAAGLATQSTVNTISSQLTTVDTVVDAILVDTDATIPGLLSTIDTVVDSILVDTDATIPGLLATVDANVDAILVDTGTTLPAQIDGISVGAASAGTTYQRYRTHETTVLDMGGSTVVTPTDAPDYPAAYVGSVIKIGAFTTTIVAWFPDEVEEGEPTVPGYYQIADSLAVQAEGTAITIYGDVQAAVELAIAEKLPAGATLIAGAGAEAETLDEVTGGGGGTVTAEDIADGQIFNWTRLHKDVTAANIIEMNASDGPVDLLFDLDNVLHPEDTLASLGSATVTLVPSGESSGFTIGTPRMHTSRRKAFVPFTDFGSANSYYVNLTFTTATSQTLTRRGRLTLR